MKIEKNYEEPLVEVVHVEVERGFAGSETDLGNIGAPTLPGGDNIFDVN